MPAWGSTCHPQGLPGLAARTTSKITTVTVTAFSGFRDAICGGHETVLYASHLRTLNRDLTLKSSVRPAFPDKARRQPGRGQLLRDIDCSEGTPPRPLGTVQTARAILVDAPTPSPASPSSDTSPSSLPIFLPLFPQYYLPIYLPIYPPTYPRSASQGMWNNTVPFVTCVVD